MNGLVNRCMADSVSRLNGRIQLMDSQRAIELVCENMRDLKAEAMSKGLAIQCI